MWLLNKDEELIQKLTLLSALHTEEVNGSNTLDFECYEEVKKLDRVIYQDNTNKWHEFIVQEVEENKETITVYAEHSAYELRGSFIEDKRPEATPFIQLGILLEKTRWTVGVVDGFPIQMMNYYRQDVYKSINDMCKKFDAYRTFEIKVHNNKVSERLVHIKKTAGYENGKRFVYSKDLQDVTRTVLMGDVVTALYGFGKGEAIGDGYGRRINFGDVIKPDSPKGQMFVSDEHARLEWGRNSPQGKVHVFSKYEFDDIEDPEELYQATRLKLQELSKPRVNYKASVTILEERHENVGIGDTVSIIDSDFRGKELRLKGRVFKIERDLIDATNSKVELGNYIDNTADANNELNQFIKDFRDKSGIWDRSNVFDNEGVLDSSYIKNIIEGWNTMLNGTGGFVYAEDGLGITTYDKAIEDNPTKAFQINGGGFRIANSKKSNGEWDWRTLGTGDGLYGDQIIANTITANQLRSDVGSSLDLNSNESLNIIIGSTETEIEDKLKVMRQSTATAQSLADDAKLKAEQAQRDAESGIGSASDAKAAADEADRLAKLAQVDADKLKLSTDKYDRGELKGAKYTFNGDNAVFKGGGLKIQNNAGADVLVADTAGNLSLTSKVQVNHSDGSYTKMDGNGMKRHTSSGGKDYHYLIHATNFVQGSASGSSPRWIQLPNDFKGKNFEIFFAIADSLNVKTYWRAIQKIVCTIHPNYAIDYANARVPVIAYKSETITDSGDAPEITTVQGVMWAIY